MMKRACVALLGAIAIAWASPSFAQTPQQAGPDKFELRAGAWDRSVQLEKQGKLADARALLMQAWGPNESYEVTVRIAWLSLRMGEYEQAASTYRVARTLPGAGPEASQGLSTSLAELGHIHLADQNRDEARLQFKEALSLNASNERAKAGLAQLAAMPTIEPELWLGYVRMPDDGPSWNGWAAFAQLPWNVTAALTLRAAFRHVDLQRQVPGVPPGTLGQGNHGGSRNTQSWRQNDVYAGADFNRPWWGVGLLGLGLFPSDADASWGGAVRGRIGRTWGLNVDASAIHMPTAWNRQLMPTLFVWPIPSLGFAAGSRITWDPAGTLGNAYAGATIKTSRVAVHLSGHAGPEHWPVNMAIPSVLTLDHKTPFGGSFAAVVSVTEVVRLGVQTQLERVSLGGKDGTYFTLSAGVQLAPSF